MLLPLPLFVVDDDASLLLHSAHTHGQTHQSSKAQLRDVSAPLRKASPMETSCSA
eukprot:m.60969 g.60969  ORF g.60969 m.60969 type:complete len:55 (-) comp13698_c1_seq2:4-168(-)